MTLNEIYSRIPIWFEAQKCIYLYSAPGLGKTTVIVESVPRLAKQLKKNLGLVVINGAMLTATDTYGYLLPRHVERNGVMRAESVFSEPFWFITTEGKHVSEYDGGIVLVDEADKMDVDVKKQIGEAALSRRLGPHVLPPGWVIWMAGNLAEHRSGSSKELDHLINRRIQVPVTPDLASLTDWMGRNSVMPLTMAFTQAHPEIVLNSSVPAKQGPYCTPRSTVGWDQFLQVATAHNNDVIPTDDLIREECEGAIGPGASAQYFTFMKLEIEAPSLATILRDPLGTPVPEKPDMQMLMCYKMAHEVTKDNIGPVIQYMNRFGKEFAVTFGVSACQRQPKLVMAKDFHRWAQSNASLLMAISNRVK